MKPVLVDSNVILDVITGDSRWKDWSSEKLAELADETLLVINPLIYAEVSVHFESVEELRGAYFESYFRRDALPYDAAFLAGKCFAAYRKRGGVRTSPMPDFYIGAHAVVARLRLLTRDASRFRAYFPHLELITP
jgi:predicted nucleic acid-binding protein